MPIEDLRRHWQTAADDSDMRCYLSMKNRVTLREFMDYLTEDHPHIDPWSVQLNFGTATWTDRPTEEELAAREQWRAKQADRQEAWERQAYDRLKAKFDPVSPPVSGGGQPETDARTETN